MNKNQSLRKDHIEAWKRYMDDSYTCDDLSLVLDLIMDDANIQEFAEVWEKEVWNKAKYDLPPMSEDQKEIFRKEAAQLLAEHENKRTTQTMQVPSRKIDRFRKIWYAAAAALLIGLLIPAVHLYVKPKTEQTVLYVEEVTGRGEIKTVFLPDQTEVTLNVESRIIFPANFTNDERSVELSGEALFDVTSDPARPFIVKTENMNIIVMGTVFGVKEYADDLSLSVIVASGKVKVGFADEKIILGKNQQLKTDKITGLFEKTTFDSGNYLSWIDGTLYFNRTPIREVVNILNRHYPRVDIELAEGEYSYLISGEHKNIYPVEDILNSIVYSTDLKCKKTGVNKYVLYHEK